MFKLKRNILIVFDFGNSTIYGVVRKKLKKVKKYRKKLKKTVDKKPKMQFNSRTPERKSLYGCNLEGFVNLLKRILKIF